MKVIFNVVEDKAFLIQRYNLGKFVKDQGNDVHVLSNKSSLSQEIINRGFGYIDSGLLRKGKNPFKELLAIFKFAKIFKNEKPDVVHNVSIKPVLYGSIAARIAKVPKVINLINGLGFVFVEDTSFTRKLFKNFILLFYKIALSSKRVKVIFQNPDDLNYFIENKIIKKEQAFLIRGSGVDTEKFNFISYPNSNKVKFLFCARMLWDKGITYLIEASRRLKEEGLEFELTFAGEPDESNPKSATLFDIKNWESEGLINYIGFQDNMPKHLNDHHVVVLPTYYREGVPLSLIEAASTARPIITTDMPGCREIVKDGINGILARPQNAEDLYNAMKFFIVNKNEIEVKGKNGRERVIDKFSKEIVNAATYKLYN
jgi:glycosyltransferase involved in cell wall biosynthesis